MFNENKLIGVGPKNYRNVCNIEKYRVLNKEHWKEIQRVMKLIIITITIPATLILIIFIYKFYQKLEYLALQF